jgi:hypothetical protein
MSPNYSFTNYTGGWLTLTSPTISVTPANPSVTLGQSAQFSSSVSGETDQSVTWSLSPQIGTISAAGYYVAPLAVPSSNTVTVTAASQKDPTATGSTTVTLTLPSNIYLSSYGGASVYEALNSITVDTNFVVSGGASVALTSGNSIVLGPGFHATAAGSGTAFDAAINSQIHWP